MKNKVASSPGELFQDGKGFITYSLIHRLPLSALTTCVGWVVGWWWVPTNCLVTSNSINQSNQFIESDFSYDTKYNNMLWLGLSCDNI